MKRQFQNRLSLMLAVVLFTYPTLATAQKAGFDLFQTAEGTSVDLKELGLGEVELRGVPINPKTLGNTDTIVRRSWDLDSDKEGIVPIYVYAMFLKSAKSVVYKRQKVDVYVTVNHSGGAISKRMVPQPDDLRPSVGLVNMRKESSEGGKFNSKLHVNANIMLVKAGTSPAVPANVVLHRAAPTVSMTSEDVPWAIKAPERYPEAAAYASGGFHATAALSHPPHRIVLATMPSVTAPITTPR